MELPFHLKTIEPLPGALDIIRFFGAHDSPTADADDICNSLDLSERRFSKAIRRLVTKGYVQMDGDMVYRLTEQGQTAVQELAEYDEATGGGLSVVDTSDEENVLLRRMVIALPPTLVAEHPTTVLIGFDDAPMSNSAEVVVRLSVVNGQPQMPEDSIFSLSSEAAYQAMRITPGSYDQIRIRLKVFQLGDNPGDIDEIGGMYVDVPVTAQGAEDQRLMAYGTDVSLTV